MSVTRPAARSLVGRCLIASSPGPAAARTPAAVQCLQQQFHTSTPRSKRRSQFRNVKASELGLTSPEGMKKYQEDKFAEYTEAEKEQLRKKYTPEQLEALEAGEKAVDPKDMIWQGRLRDDMFMPQYVDDYTTLDPRYDLKPEMEVKAEDPHFPTDEEFAEEFYHKMTKLAEKTSSDQLSRAMLRALRSVKDSPGGVEMIDLTYEELADLEKDPELLKKYLAEAENADGVEEELDPKQHSEKFLTRAQALDVDRKLKEAWKQEIDKITSQDNYDILKPAKVDMMEDAPDGIIHKHSVEQPDLGKIPGMEGMYRSASEENKDDPDGTYAAITRATGLSYREIKSLYMRTLVVRLVSNQTRLGKVRSFSVICMAGNGNGRLGIGQGKSTDMLPAALAAQGLAIRSMQPIRRYENRTIYGSVTSKISGTVAHIQARPPGFGLRVPSRVFEMCRAVGIYDLSVKFPRSKSPMNTVKALYKAFLDQPDPEQIAIGRGKKLVDARKVYYGGASI